MSDYCATVRKGYFDPAFDWCLKISDMIMTAVTILRTKGGGRDNATSDEGLRIAFLPLIHRFIGLFTLWERTALVKELAQALATIQ